MLYKIVANENYEEKISLSKIKTILSREDTKIELGTTALKDISSAKFKNVIAAIEKECGHSAAVIFGMTYIEGLKSFTELADAFATFHLACINAQIAIAQNPEKDPIEVIFSNLLGVNGRDPEFKRYAASTRTLLGAFTAIKNSYKPNNGRDAIELNEQGQIVYVNETAGQQTIADCKPLSVINYLLSQELGYHPVFGTGTGFDPEGNWTGHIYTVVAGRRIENTSLDINEHLQTYFDRTIGIWGLFAENIDTVCEVNKITNETLSRYTVEDLLNKKALLSIAHELDPKNLMIVQSLGIVSLSLAKQGNEKIANYSDTVKYFKEYSGFYEKQYLLYKKKRGKTKELLNQLIICRDFYLMTIKGCINILEKNYNVIIK